MRRLKNGKPDASQVSKEILLGGYVKLCISRARFNLEGMMSCMVRCHTFTYIRLEGFRILRERVSSCQKENTFVLLVPTFRSYIEPSSGPMTFIHEIQLIK